MIWRIHAFFPPLIRRASNRRRARGVPQSCRLHDALLFHRLRPTERASYRTCQAMAGISMRDLHIRCVRVYLGCYGVWDFECVCASVCGRCMCGHMRHWLCLPKFYVVSMLRFYKSYERKYPVSPPPLSYGLLKKLLKILKSGLTASIQYLNLLRNNTKQNTRELNSPFTVCDTFRRCGTGPLGFFR